MSKAKHKFSKKGHKGFFRRSEELSNKQLSTYVTETEYLEISNLLKELGLRKTDFIREAIQEKIKKLRK